MNTDKIYAESIAKDHSKVVALRKLDSKAKRPASIFAYTFGICSYLVAGLGMCLDSIETICSILKKCMLGKLRPQDFASAIE